MNGVVSVVRSAIAVIFFTSLLPGAALGMGATPRMPLISIEGQEANLSPVMLGVGSVFMKIVNSGNGSDNLLSAKASIPDTVVELHDLKDGKMMKVEKIQIPSGASVELKRRGLHIMIFRLPGDIREGSELTLSLMFEKAGEKKVPLRFVKPSGMPMQHDHR